MVTDHGHPGVLEDGKIWTDVEIMHVDGGSGAGLYEIVTLMVSSPA